MSHPLDDWIAGLRPLSHGSLRAYVVESWFEEPGEPASWSPEQVRLARTIFRPSPDDTRELLDAWMMLDEDDEDEETKELRNAWLCPAGPLLEGARTRLVEPTPLFSVRFLITGMISWAWGWRVIAFSQELALVAEWDDEVVRTPLLPQPLGLVARDSLYRSTALLLQHLGAEHFGDRFMGDEGGGFWEEIAPRGIEPPELYRILLASAGRGGDVVLDCDAQALIKMRELSAAHGYRDVVHAVEHAQRVQQTFRRGRP